jgi:hypothetical protein
MKFKDQIFHLYDHKDVFLHLSKYFGYLTKDEFFRTLKIIGCKNNSEFFEQCLIFI